MTKRYWGLQAILSHFCVICHYDLMLSYAAAGSRMPCSPASIEIGSIIRRASADAIDRGDIADKIALSRLNDGAEAPCFCPPGVSAKVQTLFGDRH
jgi:hypothetical protein